ncbi:Fur family transcriptional regulator [Galactobacter caseinivorans]|uniref:Transcriptional repressor n=1 Tax=Galactobacter caseinivorans TaxID=2676123 RepID=A0A496PMR1_9MICC|nr:transcriptional repressor [Galactobacter caseinivorans]RKW71818.1 transcriptional repressor [Galactobacter caseinivorans]
MSVQPAPARRVTKQRLALEAELARHDDFRTAQQIHACLSDHGDSVSLATVYRLLQQMADDSEIDAVRLDDGEGVFRRCAVEQHHHHLVCRSCGATEEVEAPEVEAWASRVAERFGFTQVGHTVELSGLCAACSAKQAGLGD